MSIWLRPMRRSCTRTGPAGSPVIANRPSESPVTPRPSALIRNSGNRTGAPASSRTSPLILAVPVDPSDCARATAGKREIVKAATMAIPGMRTESRLDRCAREGDTEETPASSRLHTGVHCNPQGRPRPSYAAGPRKRASLWRSGSVRPCTSGRTDPPRPRSLRRRTRTRTRCGPPHARCSRAHRRRCERRH